MEGNVEGLDTLSHRPLGCTAENWLLAARDARLGVGHVWNNVRCPAYPLLDPTLCTCNGRNR